MDRLESLRVFCRVVDLNSFSRAATQLQLSNATVTNHVAALETHFGVRLLNRTTRRLTVTDDGRSCYERAIRLIAEMSELEDALQGAQRSPKGILRVELPMAIGRIYFAPALHRFTEKYPDITLRVQVTDRVIDAIEERADVLVRMGDLKDSSMVARKIHQSRFVTCASPAFFARHGKPSHPDELQRLPCLGFIQPNTGQMVPWQFARQGERVEFLPQGPVAINHAESLIHTAVSGAGVVQLLSLSLTPSIKAGLLEPILDDWTTHGPQVSLLYPQSRHLSTRVRAFVDFVDELFATEIRV